MHMYIFISSMERRYTDKLAVYDISIDNRGSINVCVCVVSCTGYLSVWVSIWSRTFFIHFEWTETSSFFTNWLSFNGTVTPYLSGGDIQEDSKSKMDMAPAS